jgi:hypothetical protein
MDTHFYLILLMAFKHSNYTYNNYTPTSSSHFPPTSSILLDELAAAQLALHFFLEQPTLPATNMNAMIFSQHPQQYPTSPAILLGLWHLPSALPPVLWTSTNLNKLINNFPNDTDPQTTLPTILVTVSQWCFDTGLSSNESTTATNHKPND